MLKPDKNPWKDWYPGVLSRKQVQNLVDCEMILPASAGERLTLDASSFDLTLTDECYELTHGSVKPFGEKHFLEKIKNNGLVERKNPESDGSFKLEKNRTYIFKIRETLSLPQDAPIYGQATAKSSVGRVDVLARLIVDGMDRYEGFTPEQLAQGTGTMYLEVTPITFNVSVRQGASLSQLRLFYGDPEISILTEKELKLYSPFLLSDNPDEPKNDLSLDLTPTKISPQQCASAFKAMVTDKIVPLREEEEKPSPVDFWEMKQCDTNSRLVLETNSFYILRSRERIALPPRVAVYCRAIDETIGEMRIHYAGFVHPGFGYEVQGTPLIFEVRGHNVKVNLRQGEKMAKLTFYHMSEKDDSEERSSYNLQTLQLSKFFDSWPD